MVSETRVVKTGNIDLQNERIAERFDDSLSGFVFKEQLDLSSG